MRPTAARVREALFDILGSRVAGADVLDVFAGTGAVGIEALSRGARGAVFVESDARAARLIEANLRAAGFSAEATVVASDAGRALDALAARGASFAIVFLDPPYAAGATAAILERSAGLVAPGGVLVVEDATRGGADLVAPGLRAGRRYRYGDSRLSVFHRDPPATERHG
jgi:16S rRNA (guanine966-N2)-methyltransferase